MPTTPHKNNMSVYVDEDNDVLNKKRVQLLCVCCSVRFIKYRIDIDDLKKFDAMAEDFRQHEFGRKCDGDKPEKCLSCTTVLKSLHLCKPFECWHCGLVFASALHLQMHKESSEACIEEK